MYKVALACFVLFFLALPFASAITDTSLLAYYKFDESSGDLIDYYSYDNNGTNANITYSQTGIINNAYSYNGSSSKTTLATESIFDFEYNDDYSICTWIKTTDTDGTIYGKYDGSKGYALRIYLSKIYFVQWSNSGTGKYNAITTDNNFNDNTWHLVCGTSTGSGAASGLKIYIDGSTTATTILSNTRDATILQNSSPLLGDLSSTAHDYYSGLLDEMSIWYRELSITDIQDLYNSGNGNTYPFLGVDANFDYTEDKSLEIEILEDNSTIVGATSITSWSWEVDGIEVSTAQDYNYTVTELTDYNICLTVDTNNGLTDSICKTVNTSDWTVPTTSFSSFQVTGTTDTNITLTCTDNNSGCKTIHYKIDNNLVWTDINAITSNPYSFLYSGIGDHNIQYFSTDNADNNETTNTDTFTTYGLASFTLKDQNSSTDLNDVVWTVTPSISGSSGGTITGDHHLDLNLQGITNTTYTFTFTKTGYSTRTYKTDLNQLTEVDKNFALLPDTIDADVPFKVYATDETTLFTNTYVEILDSDTNWTVGRNKTDSVGEVEFNLKADDSNYYAIINNGAYTYVPVALTILYPKNEQTLAQITEKWRIDITQNLYASYTDLNTTKVIYLLPNTSLPYNIEISDMNGNYFSRTYAKQYPGNPTTDTLQPYLVSATTGLLTTINTIDKFTLKPIPDIKIKIYKYISGLGRTYVEEINTDSKGQALVLLVLNGDYEFEIYQDATYIRTDSIKAAANVIYVKLVLTNPITYPDEYYIVNTTFTPSRNSLILQDTSISLTSTITQNDTTTEITSIRVIMTNTKWQGTSSDHNLVNTLYNYAGSTSETLSFDLNVTEKTIAGQTYDTNGILKITVIVTLDDGNTFTYIKQYAFPGTRNLTQLFSFNFKQLLSCSSDPNEPCVTALFIALFISLVGTIALAIETGFGGMESMALIFLLFMGLFTFLEFVPVLLFGLMLIATILIYIASGGNKV